MKIIQLHRDNVNRAKQMCNAVRNGVDEATIYIYDMIDPYWGVSATSFVAALNSVSDAKVLHLRINSPGGDVFEGRAIVEAIKRFAGKTIAHVDSLAASAASSIAIAANEVEIAPGAFFMIHNASGMVWGDKTDMRTTADLLEKVEGTIVADYVAKTGKTTEEVVAWMDAETWFTGDEAVANGFADRTTPAAANAAQNTAWNLAAFDKAPAALANRGNPPAAPEIVPPAPGTTPETTPDTTGKAQSNRNALRLALIA